VIITDSLSTMMAVSNRKRTKNHKTQTTRKLMDQQGEKITLLRVSGHVGITGNENADTAAKKALNERIQITAKYPPQDLKWIERKYQADQQQHDNRDERAQTTHQKQHRHPNNDPKGSSGN
jgi:ribonuclease HI